jgi:hypothetical protein
VKATESSEILGFKLQPLSEPLLDLVARCGTPFARLPEMVEGAVAKNPGASVEEVVCQVCDTAEPVPWRFGLRKLQGSFFLLVCPFDRLPAIPGRQHARKVFQDEASKFFAALDMSQLQSVCDFCAVHFIRWLVERRKGGVPQHG